MARAFPGGAARGGRCFRVRADAAIDEVRAVSTDFSTREKDFKSEMGLDLAAQAL